MKERSKNNSIIFLTTLSVYLGLVLVGGTPSVLAQTANSVNKNLPTRIVINECDSSELGNEARRLLYKLGYKSEFISFLPTGIAHSFDEDNLRGIFDINVSVSFSEKDFPTYSITHHEEKKIGENSDSETPEIIESVLNLSKSYACLPQKNGQKTCLPTTVKSILSKEEFYVSVNFSESTNERAKEFADAYQYFIDEGICLYKDSNDLTALLNRSTKVFSENNQVFIVTRLPRGSLDALLKQDAKADGK